MVLNAPTLETRAGGSAEPVPDIRGALRDRPGHAAAGLQRGGRGAAGLGVMVEALPRLPEAHVAFVVNKPQSAYVKGLLRRAEELGVAERVHVLPYVPH